jgi:hypothetical protein
MATWNTDTHPYLVRWSHPTGDRLTRYTDTTQEFATEQEAIDALCRPFGKNTSDGHIVKFERIGRAPMLAKRKRGKQLVRMD